MAAFNTNIKRRQLDTDKKKIEDTYGFKHSVSTKRSWVILL